MRNIIRRFTANGFNQNESSFSEAPTWISLDIFRIKVDVDDSRVLSEHLATMNRQTSSKTI